MQIAVKENYVGSFNSNLPVYINDSADAARFISSKINDLKHENLVVLYLDEQKRVLASENYISNSPSRALVEAAELLRSALMLKAKSIILGHNHPSNTIVPSQKDIRSTMHIKKACWYVNINLIDHLILSGNKYCSLRNFGLV